MFSNLMIVQRWKMKWKMEWMMKKFVIYICLRAGIVTVTGPVRSSVDKVEAGLIKLLLLAVIHFQAKFKSFTPANKGEYVPCPAKTNSNF